METRQIVLAAIYLVGFYCLGDATYDQLRGVAKVLPSRKANRVNLNIIDGYEVVSKEKDPERFKELMTYQWTQAFIAFLIGYGISRIYKDADRSDPFSPGFDGWRDDDKPDKS